MACVTLKRPLDFDPLEVLHSPNRPPTKRRRCTPIKNVDSMVPSMSSAAAAAANASTAPEQSVFRETPLAQGEISNNLRDELKRMKRRRQPASQKVAAQSATSLSIPNCSLLNSAVGLQHQPSSPIGCGLTPGTSESMKQQEGNMPPKSTLTQLSRISVSGLDDTFRQIALNTEADGSHEGSNIQCNSSNIPSSISNITPSMITGDKKVFTLKEMTLICERMCKERTELVRQEYDKILHQKLSEQYDAFVKFIDHQIQQRFNESQLPSYLS